jgi:hypothetical protein
MRMIATEPDLERTRPETYRQWREESIGYIAHRLALPPDDVVAQAAGAAVQTAIMSGLSWWALQDDPELSPAVAVVRALRGLGDATRPGPRSA